MSVLSSISGFDFIRRYKISSFIRRNKISKTKTNEKAETESPWRAPLLSEKYFLVVSPLITHDSWSLGKVYTLQIKSLQKPYFSSMEIRKLWSNESNAFWMSLTTRKPSNFFTLSIFVTSDINLPLSPMRLFLTYAVCSGKIKSGRKRFE